MIKLKRPFVIALSVAVLLVISLQTDPVAGHIPQREGLKALSQFLSLLGNGVVLIPASIALFLLGLSFKDPRMKEAGQDGLFSILLAGAAVNVLKAAFERPRIAARSVDSVISLLTHPSLFDVTGRFSSFPSGHSAASFALAYALSKRYPRLSVLFYAIAALIAASRVYLGSHYPSDVVAGAFVGVVAGRLIFNRGSKERWLHAGLILLIVFISFFKTGSFLLFDIDEAVFSEASREMVDTGNLITPTYGYEPRYDKPILIYWLMSASFKLLGVNEFAARFTSALFGSLLAVMTFFFVKRARGPLSALFVTLALVLNLEYFVYSHSAVTDMTLTFFISASVFSFYLAVNEGKRLWFISFWICCALAVLTKGVIGILFPVATAVIFLAASKDLKKLNGFIKPQFIALFLIISVPWFAIQFYINGWEFFNAFIIKHHIKRYSGVISSHGGPLYYYAGVLLLGFFPWAAFLPGALYRGFKERLRADSSLCLLSAVWFALVFVFFSIARTKLPNYVFPLFPAASILSGISASELIEKKWTSKKDGLYVLFAISALTAVALFMLPSMNIKMDVALPPRFFYVLGSIFLVIAAFSVMAFYGTLPSLIGISAMMVIMIIFLRLQALPQVNLYLQKTLYSYSVYARSLGKDAVVATYELNKPSVAFYAQRKILKVEKGAQCDIRENAKRGTILVITSRSRYDELKEFNLRVINAEGDYMLLSNSDNLPPYKGN